MYNEVFYPCPSEGCHGLGYMQIKPQIVLGFGGFNLLDPDTLKELSVEQLHELKAAVLEDKFRCTSCEHWFNPYHNDDDWHRTVRELFQ